MFPGVIFSIRVLGPRLGFILGGLMNKNYVTLGGLKIKYKKFLIFSSFCIKKVFQEPPEGLTNRDPRWIGSWWLGYLIISAVLVLPALILCSFPAKKVQLHAKNKKRESFANKNKKIEYEKNGKELNDLKRPSEAPLIGANENPPSQSSEEEKKENAEKGKFCDVAKKEFKSIFSPIK